MLFFLADVGRKFANEKKKLFRAITVVRMSKATNVKNKEIMRKSVTNPTESEHVSLSFSERFVCVCFLIEQPRSKLFKFLVNRKRSNNIALGLVYFNCARIWILEYFGLSWIKCGNDEVFLRKLSRIFYCPTYLASPWISLKLCSIIDLHSIHDSWFFRKQTR